MAHAAANASTGSSDDERRGKDPNDRAVAESQRLTTGEDPRTADLESGRAEAPEDATAPTIGSRIAAWLRSPKFLEQLLCVIYLLLCFVPITVTTPEGNQRPIPFQFLQPSSEYVRNLVNNEMAKGQTVSDGYLFLFGMALPFIVQGLSGLCWGKAGDLHSTFCATLVAQGSNFLATECLKLYVGYLRPIFYELCEPDSSYQQCTGTSHNISESRKSFPSGHASVSFCGLTLLALYLHNRFGLPSTRRLEFVPIASDSGASNTQANNAPLAYARARVIYTKQPTVLYRFLSVLLVGVPLAVAAFIAASRVVDNYHFPADVVAGTLLGSSISLFVYGLWFDE